MTFHAYYLAFFTQQYLLEVTSEQGTGFFSFFLFLMLGDISLYPPVPLLALIFSS